MAIVHPSADPVPAARRASSASVTRPASWPPYLVRLTLALVAVGVGWRTLRYLLQLPIWGDEAFVCLNFLDRTYLQLAQPLRYNQVAPILFLWAQMASYRLLGSSELALRLLSFVSGLGALALFWRLARLAVGPLAGALAVGILAVSYYPVRHSCEVKPYALDLLMALALLVSALSWLRAPHRLGWLALLTALVPLTLAASYPAAFVAGAISLALLPTVARQAGWSARGLYLAYNLLMVGTFGALYWFVARGQYVSTGGSANPFWEEWFPPGRPLALLLWLADVHTGNLLAYPVGGHDGGSIITCLLCLVGAWQLGRGRHRDLLLLLLGPFALTFVAAALHRYPYGGSARVAQHLAPAICLLAGIGAAAVVASLHLPTTRWRCTLAVGGLLALIGVVGMLRDVFKPYKTDGDRQARAIVDDVFHECGSQDQIVVLDPARCLGPTFEWYLRRRGQRIIWNGEVDWDGLNATARHLWCLGFSQKDLPTGTLARLALAHRPWFLISHDAYTLQMGHSQETIEHCEIFHWVCLPGERQAAHLSTPASAHAAASR